MSIKDWFGLPDWFVPWIITICVLWMIMERLKGIGKQLEWMTARLRQDMAELAGKSERARELREGWRQEQEDEKRKERRLELIIPCVVGAAILVWWLYTAIL